MRRKFLLLFLLSNVGFAQKEEFNYDESAVPAYKLPECLVSVDGQPVTTAEQWKEKRRPELLNLFADHIYGRTPSTPADLKIGFTVGKIDDQALDGKATRKEVTLRISRGERQLDATLLLYIPKATRPVPAFLGLNFGGNHAVHADPGISLNPNWMRNDPKKGINDHKAHEGTRGTEASRWQVEMIVKEGFALATMYYGDIDPDYGENQPNEPDSWQNGIHPFFYEPSQRKPGPYQWGSIGAWAWGLSRALDYLETDPSINAKQVAVIGHSRLGKTSLWAGVLDERFGLVISNNSGCGGAALSKRWFGETTKRINTSFPHWFSDQFVQYNDREVDLPIDQHQLLALVAPRPLYVASAVEDRWADPRGEFLAAYHADPVYRLLGVKGLEVTSDAMPDADHPLVKGNIGYHLRTGAHDVTAYDWQQYLSFAKKHFQ
jgi:hypothetical protein